MDKRGKSDDVNSIGFGANSCVRECVFLCVAPPMVVGPLLMAGALWQLFDFLAYTTKDIYVEQFFNNFWSSLQARLVEFFVLPLLFIQKDSISLVVKYTYNVHFNIIYWRGQNVVSNIKYLISGAGHMY